MLTIAGTTDKVTISNYLHNDGVTSFQLEHIKFANGTVWKLVDVKAMLLLGSANPETLTGYATDDSINGGAGNDSLYGRAGNDTLKGDDGNDSLNGEIGNDLLLGGAGNDTLGGSTGNDILDGGSGNDSLNGGTESDTYRFGRGSGQDTINNYDTSIGKTDVLEFAADIAPSDILLSRSGDSLVLTIAGTSDKVTISNYLHNDGVTSSQLEHIEFANGTVWNLMNVKAMLLQGSANADTLTAYASDDIINGNAGNDILYGRAGNDTLYGDDGNDTLYGEIGNDSLLGGEGNDSLNGSSGNDILDGENGIDSLYGGEGDDYLMGGIDKDTYTLTETNASTDTLRIRAGDSLMGGFDIVNGFKLGTGSGTTLGIDKLDLDYDLIAGNINSANGIDSGIIRSHSIVNGKISFDDIDEYTTALSLTTSNLSNVFSYLQNNITTLGSTVAFTASGSTYVFQDNGINDTLVQLAGITAGSISTLGLVADGVWIG